MPTDTKESGFEALTANWLVEQNGYEQGVSANITVSTLRTMRTTLPALIISGVIGAAIITMAIVLLRSRGAWLIAGFNMLPE
jgi:hypothetical protein